MERAAFVAQIAKVVPVDSVLRGLGALRARLLARLTVRRATRRAAPAVPFIVLTSHRTGSNLLVSLLDAHPDVATTGEVLSQHVPLAATCPDAAPRDRWRPVHLLDAHVFDRNDVAASGCKVFYHHATGFSRSAWDYLDALPDLRVIHLRRRDRLARYVSYLRAASDVVWVAGGDHEPPSDRIEVDPDGFARHVEMWDDRRRRALARLAGHAVLEVWYEDLVADREATMTRVFDHLGVGARPVASAMQRQRMRPLEEVVVDYERVAAQVAPLRAEPDGVAAAAPATSAGSPSSFERRMAEQAIRRLEPVVGDLVRGVATMAVPAARRRGRRLRKDLVPFVVLTAGRSGSTLLTYLLDDHPQVFMAGELLNHRNPIRQALPGAREHELLRPVRLMERRVFSTPDVDAAGFKLFYHHGMRSMPTAWAYFEAMPHLRVIHLQREDNLARYVSLHRALRDGRWTSQARVQGDDTPLDVDVEHFIGWVQLWRQRRALATARLRAKPCLELWYDDLAEHRDVEMARVFDFLGLPDLAVDAPLERQRTRPLAEVVANWDDIVDRVEPWRWGG